MAGVHSPSDAFAHLQHHQHNGLLGPSMQVRGPRTSLTSSTAHCNPCQRIVVPPLPSQYPYITSLSFIRLCGLLVLLGCLVYSTILAWAVLHFRLSRLPLSYKYISVFIVSVTHPPSKLEKAFRGSCYSICKKAIFEACCLSTVLTFYTFLCLIDV